MFEEKKAIDLLSSDLDENSSEIHLSKSVQKMKDEAISTHRGILRLYETELKKSEAELEEYQKTETV